MPNYEFRNEETEEVETHMVTFADYDQFLLDNPHLKRVYSAPAFVTGSGSHAKKAGDGWNDLMKTIKKGSDSQSTINTK